MSDDNVQFYPLRRHFVFGLLLLVAIALIWRLVDLQVLRKDFLQGQGDARALRVVSMSAHRGMVLDRHGEPLAISTPVDSIWMNPRDVQFEGKQRLHLAKLLGMDSDSLQSLLATRKGREFVYLKRRVHPDLARDVMALKIPGIALQREYRRYYPTGEVSGHVVGFTNVDDVGQEGIELSYDDWLRGHDGSKRVLKDRLGHVIADVESIRQPEPGRDLLLSIDRRLQYLAYSELKAAVQKHKARSGSLVLLDAKTGEVLAMVNQPAFNPNNRKHLQGERYRNRAVTDVFEPGSTMKPFTVSAALEQGLYQPDTIIDTTPGFYQVGGNTVRDIHNYGSIDVATVITKSSNVGASKIALSLPPEQLWQLYSRVGFGEVTSSGFPGETGGMLSDYRKWREIDRATLAFGYGLSVTPLQLAQAYTVFANDGALQPVTLQRVDDADAIAPAVEVMRRSTANDVLHMLESVVAAGGTGTRAQVRGYRIAGKTGTVRKSGIGGYVDDKYVAVFAGLAPVSQPQLVCVVMINEPGGDEYYGGQVAGPVFANVMAGALRLLNIAPDALPQNARFAQAGTADSSPAETGGRL
ncbi:MAG: penicillin-binding transpeptidase domain-containing protein [Granulosicoccaceae bacterium]|jgi:cell division protein FtsI (penicillin-binding protein 3)